MLAQLTLVLFVLQQPLVEQPAAAPLENLIAFDWQQVETRWVNRHWQLQAGVVWLKDFGSHDFEAREATRLIRALRLTHRGTVGEPLPVMEYWLSEGRAPQTLSHVASRLTEMELDNLRAEQIQDSWCVRDNRRVFFNFGNQQAEAQRAVAIIRHHGFTHIGYLGQPVPSMIYFVSRGTGLGGGSLLAPRSLAPASIPVEPKASTTPPDAALQNRVRPRVSPEELKQMQQAAALAPQLSPPLVGKVATLRFDSRELLLRQQGFDWALFHGNIPLASFGSDPTSAQLALQLLQSHRCTEQILVGRPPRFSYFLSLGQAPRGLRPGLNGINFRPEQVVAKKVEQTWLVADGARTLANFGSDHEGAVALAEAMRRHQFDTLVWIGQGQQRMSMLLRAR